MRLTENRKSEHLSICLTQDVQAKKVKTGFEEVHLLHRAIPEISLSDVDTSTSFFGRRLKAPLIIEAMTGGTSEASKINGALAETAESLGLAMGVGSQRAAFESSRFLDTYRIARENGPHVFLIANLGLPQILSREGVEYAKKAVDMIDADALAIHLNILQEAIQREGETLFEGLHERLREITSKLAVPVIVKETGAGITSEVARLLDGSGVRGIDVGGAGGTSWAAVESFRGKGTRKEMGRTFWDWGIPTAVSIVETSMTSNLVVIGSGGVRTGVDIAKAIALGADAAGVALPLLKPAIEGKLDNVVNRFVEELKMCMFLTGNRKVQDLKQKSIVVTGNTAEWLSLRGFKADRLARRESEVG
jgi:isopentenyl-diphosphate delta-isomerase